MPVATACEEMPKTQTHTGWKQKLFYVFDLRMIFFEIFYVSPVFSFTFTKNAVNSAVMCLADNFLPVHVGLTGKHHITWHNSSISVNVGWGFNQGVMWELTNESIRAFVSSSAQAVWSVTYQGDIPVTRVSAACLHLSTAE